MRLTQLLLGAVAAATAVYSALVAAASSKSPCSQVTYNTISVAAGGTYLTCCGSGSSNQVAEQGCSTPLPCTIIVWPVAGTT